MAQKRDLGYCSKIRGICNQCTGQLGSPKTFYKIHLTVGVYCITLAKKIAVCCLALWS